MIRVAAKVKGLQEHIETSNVVWFGDGGTDQKTERSDKDVEVLFGSDADGWD